jgi:hypothetical protein
MPMVGIPTSLVMTRACSQGTHSRTNAEPLRVPARSRCRWWFPGSRPCAIVGTMKSKPSKRELNPVQLANALMPRLRDRTAGRGELLFPAVPSLVPHYHQVVVELFGRLSRPPSREDSEALRGQLEHWARWGWEQSPFCRVHLSWETNEPRGVDCRIQVEVVTVEEEYSRWRARVGGDLFGERPWMGRPVILAVTTSAKPSSSQEGMCRSRWSSPRILVEREASWLKQWTFRGKGNGASDSRPHFPRTRRATHRRSGCPCPSGKVPETRMPSAGAPGRPERRLPCGTHRGEACASA